MPLIHICKCDSCGKSESMTHRLSLPNGWYVFNVIHNQEVENDNGEFVYCDKCGKRKKSEQGSKLTIV